MSFTPITVTGGPWDRPDGTPATGTVVFRLTGDMRSGTQWASIGERAVVLDATGRFSTVLAANDDVGVDPPNVSYEVTVKLDGEAPVTSFVRVPHAAPGATIDLSAL